MTTTASPIRGKPHTRDPMRNFVFRVDFIAINGTRPETAKAFASFGFVSVSGQGIQTEMIPYREGGDNTITRKIPGQSDVGPLQLIRGVYIDKSFSPMNNWYKHIFSVQWGKGLTTWDGNFRMDVVVRVLKHPVTSWGPGGKGDPKSNKSAGMLTRYYNAWPSAIQWNDLNAGDNSVMVETMTLQHEGFDVYYGEKAGSGTTRTEGSLTASTTNPIGI